MAKMNYPSGLVAELIFYMKGVQVDCGEVDICMIVQMECDEFDSCIKGVQVDFGEVDMLSALQLKSRLHDKELPT